MSSGAVASRRQISSRASRASSKVRRASSSSASRSVRAVAIRAWASDGGEGRRGLWAVGQQDLQERQGALAVAGDNGLLGACENSLVGSFRLFSRVAAIASRIILGGPIVRIKAICPPRGASPPGPRARGTCH